MRIVVDNDNYYVAGSLAEYVECEYGTCQAYSGAIPTGFSSYEDWFIECNCKNAYKLVNGDLILDIDKEAELQAKIDQETIDNTPLVYKDLYSTNEVIESQYKNATATGKILTLSNVKSIAPTVMLTNINCYAFNKINVIATGKNMLPNEATSKTIDGICFTINADGSILINGTATADIEYSIAGTSTNTSPFLVFKKGFNYYLSCGYTIKMYHYDGTDRTQIYSDVGGLISFAEDKKITQTVLHIPNGTTFNNVTIYPMLNLGTAAEPYEKAKINTLEINFSDFVEEGLFPSDDLFPSDNLFPAGTTIDYILIQSGVIYISVINRLYYYGKGNVGLFNGYNVLYTSQDINIEADYFIDELIVEKTLNSKIEKTAEDITLEVSKTYATKSELNTTKSEIKQTTDSITSTVSKKVGNDEIISKINQSAEQITIQADKININGTVSANGNFKVDTNGNMTCNNATMKNINIANGQIRLDGDDNTQIIAILKSDNSGLQLEDSYITLKDSNRNGISCYSNLNGEAYMQLVSTGGTTQIKNTGISTPVLNQTSIEENKKNFEKLEDALNIVKDIDIYKYNLKAEEDGTKKHIGFVIGDNYRYSKEVTSTENDGADIYSLASVCLKAIQELLQENDNLKHRVEALEKGENNEEN